MLKNISVFLPAFQPPQLITLQPASPIAFLASTQKVNSFCLGQNWAQLLTCRILRCLFCRIPGLPGGKTENKEFFSFSNRLEEAIRLKRKIITKILLHMEGYYSLSKWVSLIPYQGLLHYSPLMRDQLGSQQSYSCMFFSCSRLSSKQIGSTRG